MEKGRVLIVDDEQSFGETVLMIVEGLGYEAEYCNSGWAAYDIALTKKFDVVVSDVQMPNGDGVELLLRLRAIDPSYPPVILMTGYSKYDFKNLLEEGALAILSKPFEFDDLAQCLDSALGVKRKSG